MRRLPCLVAFALAAVAVLSACAPKPLPAGPSGLVLQPGRYVSECYFAPGFKPGEVAYALTPFTVAAASDVDAPAFLNLFQEELTWAWQAQGLKLNQGDEAVRLSGTIHHLSIWGSRLRLVTGRVHAVLTLSGTIARGDQVLFAFRDRVLVSSPLAPGPAAPQERLLLLRHLARETVTHLLNELLLQGETAESG